MTGTIRLTGVRAMGTHGVLESEHSQPQDFSVDVTLDFDMGKAIATDDVAHTINYAEVAEKIVAVIEGEHCDLIEKLADRIASAILDSRVHHVSVTVHKPHAPISVDFDDVSVSISREGPLYQGRRRTAVIGMGSNLDNPIEHLRGALQELSELDVTIKAVSPVYSSEPILAEGQEEQPDYLNAVVIIETEVPPLTLLWQLQEIENQHGRKRTERWGVRTLDLDIVDMSDIACDSEELTIPHPRAHQRRFVLEPWLAADPNATIHGLPLPAYLSELVFQEVTQLEETLR